jgi:hypothetical protein
MTWNGQFFLTRYGRLSINFESLKSLEVCFVTDKGEREGLEAYNTRFCVMLEYWQPTSMFHH